MNRTLAVLVPLAVLFAAPAAGAVQPRMPIAPAGQWISGGPSFPNVSDIVVHPQIPGTVYAVADGRLMRSSDSAGHWSRAMEGLPDNNVYSIVIDSSNPSTLYVGVNGSIFKTIDGGSSWIPLSGSPPGYHLAVDPIRPRVLYATSADALFRTSDGGMTWTEKHLPAASFGVGALAVFGELVYLSQGEGGLWRSTDAGASWAPLSGLQAIGLFVLAVDTLPVLTVYAVGESVFKSTDSGATWHSTGPPDSSGFSSFAIDPSDPQTLYLGGQRVFRSDDGGSTWTSIEDGLTYAARVYDGVSAIAVDRTDTAVVYAGTTHDGLFKSRNRGVAWTSSDDGFPARPALSVAIDAGGPAIAYAASGRPSRVFRTDDSGSHWSETAPISPSLFPAGWFVKLTADPVKPLVLHLSSGVCLAGIGGGYCSGGTYKSSDGGRSWIEGTTCASFALAFSPRETSPMYSMCAHNLAWPVSILTSADGGESWNGIGDFEAGIPSTLLVDPQTSSILYAAGRFGVFKSVTGGRTWFFSGSGLASLDVRALAASTPSVLYAGTGNGVFKSVDGAAHWEATAFGDFVSALAINPRDPLNLFVGTETGVYQSNDGGKHWTAMNLGLSSLNVHTLAIDAEGRVLYAATEEGVFERKLRRTLALSPR